MNMSTRILSDRDALIRERQNRVIANMTAVPEPARSTIVTTGTVTEGLACTATQGRFETRMDLGRGMGGDASAPSPGFYARAAIAGCIAIAIKMTAARRGLTIRQVQAEVATDFDDGALFGLGNASAAPTETRITIRIDSDEERTAIDALVARALAADPWFLALRDPQKVVVAVET